MDDKVNSQEPQPIFETVPTEETNKDQAENLQPEEVPSEVATPSSEEVSQGGPPPPPNIPPVMYEDSKNKYIVIVGAVIFFLILLFVFTRIFFGRRATKKEAMLTYWGLWEDKEIFQPLIEQYQRNNPYVKIEYQKMAREDYREKLVVRSKNGEGPDIFRFHNTWIPEIQEVISPLPQNVMSNGEFEKTFYSIHQKDLKIKDKYYGLPLEIDGLVLVYNRSCGSRRKSFNFWNSTGNGFKYRTLF
ncbi:extracellular solute-binding protein [Candidatus Roizmanbacteria bacterium]|nr:extracellular solute-binding protein [Candidatus Roizmanbacteria bacterium]